MRRRQAVYGLDIETDTTENGLDPRVAAVVTVALVGPTYEEVFTGPESQLLTDLDARLAQLEPGVLATWNGSAFDLPFLADRAAACAQAPRTCTCTSRSCASGIAVGASSNSARADVVLGNATTSRRLFVPVSIITSRSKPKAKPACGGAP